jgi:hypothetical protein
VALTDDEKCRIIARDIRTPWSRKRLARAMCGLRYDPPSRLETIITPLYLDLEDLQERVSRRAFSWFLRTFVGIDNRSREDLERR